MMRDRYASLINVLAYPGRIEISDLQLNWHQVFKFCQELDRKEYSHMDRANADMYSKS